MPDSIVNAINSEVVETIDDEVLAIKTESMVGVVDSKVIHYFAWKPGWVEHNVQGLEHSILLPPASSLTTASTISIASVAGIPSSVGLNWDSIANLLITTTPIQVSPPKPIVTDVSINHRNVGGSAKFIDGSRLNFDAKLRGMKLGCVTTPVLISTLYHVQFSRALGPTVMVLLESHNSPLHPVPTLIAQAMLNFAPTAPKFFYLDDEPEPPGPYTCFTTVTEETTMYLGTVFKNAPPTMYAGQLIDGIYEIMCTSCFTTSDDYRVASSSTMIFDSFLGLKESKDGKQRTKRDANFKNDFNPSLNMVSYVKSIMGLNLNQKLDLFDNFEKQPASQNLVQKLKDLFAKPSVDCISAAKETQDGNLLSSIRYEHTESVKSISKIISSILEEHLHYQIPLLSLFFKDLSTESTELITCLAPLSLPASFTTINDKYYQAVDCNHLQMVQTEDKMPLNLKELLSSTKAKFLYLQSQIQNSLKQMESQIEVLATAAQGYHKVVQAYMSSCNMMLFLYGSFRGINTVIDWTGEDGSFVALDPLNLNKDGTKLLQFNRIFGTTASQIVVFADAQQLISSIMAGYNVCVFSFVKSTADVLNLMKNNYLNRAVRSSFPTPQRSRFHSIVMVLING
ncbi:putative minus-end-directed kinesin ATPase [Helianthus annuus]|nr:putative minus-end-directed kinesin ATPase [Helianthus annuus]